MQICIKCGAEHGMGVEEVATGKIKPIDLCYDCLWDGWLGPDLMENQLKNQEILNRDIKNNTEYLVNEKPQS